MDYEKIDMGSYNLHFIHTNKFKTTTILITRITITRILIAYNINTTNSTIYEIVGVQYSYKHNRTILEAQLAFLLSILLPNPIHLIPNQELDTLQKRG